MALLEDHKMAEAAAAAAARLAAAEKVPSSFLHSSPPSSPFSPGSPSLNLLLFLFFFSSISRRSAPRLPQPLSAPSRRKRPRSSRR